MISRGRAVDKKVRLLGSESGGGQALRLSQLAGRIVQIVKALNLGDIGPEGRGSQKFVKIGVGATSALMAGHMERENAFSQVSSDGFEVGSATLICEMARQDR